MSSEEISESSDKNEQHELVSRNKMNIYDPQYWITKLGSEESKVFEWIPRMPPVSRVSAYNTGIFSTKCSQKKRWWKQFAEESEWRDKGKFQSICRTLKGQIAGTETFSYFRSYFTFGERGSGVRARGEIQDFEKLRDKCLREGRLFEDPEFPATDISIFYSRTPPRPFEWKRPHELAEDPVLFHEGATRFDVVQGELGDCWLLAAVANLTLNQGLFYQVVPDDQSFSSDYAGIFHFRFWQYGRWIDVVIDDLLPTYRGRLVFMHSTEKNEFWSALLEKAYAKLHGSYEALKGGTTCEAMEDFTGGVTESFELKKAPPNMLKIMLKAYERWSLMGCSIEPNQQITEMELSNGLICGHAYSITAIRMVEVNTPRVNGKIPLLRIRNPWGNECEWKGPWSDRSPEWTMVSENERKELGLTFDHDGEFWMSFKDFLQNFTRLEICNLHPDSLTDDPLTKVSKKKWDTHVFEGGWVRGVSAGGCRNFLDTFWINPQYNITLEDVDDDDDDETCTMIVALMQKNRRCKKKMGLDCLTIGFSIYHLKNAESLPKPLAKDFFKYNASVAKSPSFINLREVNARFKLSPGTYCIIPSTFDPGEEGDFILRVFTEKENKMSEYDEKIELLKPDDEPKAPAKPKHSMSKLHVQVKESQEEKDKDSQIKDFFSRIAGEDLEIDCYELQEILNFALRKEFNFDGFSVDVCRSMIAMMDVDRSGKLGLEEFKNLWMDVRMWKNVFKNYDKDGSGFLNTMELRMALNSAGYRVNFHILRALVIRYGKNEKISFDDFIMCAVKLKTMIGSSSTWESYFLFG
ncbi:calpain-B-like isoform X3 [Limulus polyphemus]|uniref:Calpain-B-like isoform X3 n=1 Tax=Limulus polyphemus TaxID=6850 RepID=A0ABM1SB72_LIMPO|nr:calpain-B-like isoform X3 [Limulus polyphemus]